MGEVWHLAASSKIERSNSEGSSIDESARNTVVFKPLISDSRSTRWPELRTP